MKHILTLLVILIIPYISYGQTFNELLSETLDSTYKDITKTSHIHIKGYIKNSMPYKFKASDQIETLKNQNQQILPTQLWCCFRKRQSIFID